MTTCGKRAPALVLAAVLLAMPSGLPNAPVLAVKIRIGEDLLELFSLIATIGMSADANLDDLRIETLLPANDATRTWFARRFS